MQRGFVLVKQGRETLKNLVLLLFVTLTVLLLLLALPILLPLVSFQVKCGRRRLCATAEVTPCGHCGRLLRRAAVEAADASWTAFFDGTTRQGVRPRVVRQLFARCPSCGAGHGWDEHRRALYLLSVDQWGRPIPPG